MRLSWLVFLMTGLLMFLVPGCATYRESDSVTVIKPLASQPGPARSAKDVLLSENGWPGRQWQSLGEIRVSVRKRSVFDANPTVAQVNDVLRERGLALGADAVIQVHYSSGIGWTTWGYLNAGGLAVRFVPAG